MVNTSGCADVIWLIFLYSLFYATLSNVEGSEPGCEEKNKLGLCRCEPNMMSLVKKPSLVVSNLKVDLERLEMTWDPNVTVTGCYVDTPPKLCDYGEITNTTCHFESVRLHKGATFIAEIKYMNQNLLETIYLPPEEMDGTSVENFSCILDSVSSLNCTWDAGRNAPDDVQYFLYLKNSAHRREPKKECPHYINNAFGRHIACHIPKMTDELPENYYFYVNGSSSTSQIRYYDALLELCDCERLGPPQSVSTDCSQLVKCRIQWTPPPNNENCGSPHYEIKDELKNITEILSDNYKYINVEEKHIIRIRMFKVSYKLKIYGDWSEQIILDLPPQPIPLPTITLILVALGIILMILIQFFLCKRFHIWQKITSPVPQPKNIFQQYIKNMENEWVDPIPTAHEPDEKITVIEEVNDGLKK